MISISVVEPDQLLVNRKERFKEDFIFFDKEHTPIDLEFNSMDVSLHIGKGKISGLEPDGSLLNIKFDDDVMGLVRDKEGIHHGTFVIEWEDAADDFTNSRRVPFTLAIDDPLSVLPLKYLRESLWDIAKDNRLHEFKYEFSPFLLLRAKESALEKWNAQPGGHKKYSLGKFPEKFRHQWAKGVFGECLAMMSRALMGNALPYEAAGLSVQADEQRASVYMDLAEKYRQEWLMFITEQQYYDAMSRSYGKIG